MASPEISIVIPVYNEESNLPELIERCLKSCGELKSAFEIILVDDGSADSSADIITKAANDHPGEIVGVILSTNYGQHAAVTAGLEVSQGKYVITMDADLQNPPEEIPNLAAELRKGYDVVGTIREKRQDTIFRKLASKTVNLMVRSMCRGKPMTDYGCMLRGYSRNVVNLILRCPENGKFIPMLAMSFARKSTEIHVKHADRKAGESKYDLKKLISLQYDLLTSTTTFPLRVLTYFGTVIAFLGALFGAFLIVMRFIQGSEWAARGVFSLFAILFVFVGLQFMAMGLLGEYIGKIFLNTRQRPQYAIETVIRKSQESR